MLDTLFISVLNMSLISSYVIVFVLISRFFLKKAPKIFSYSLWLIALFRLLCPASFESVLSLMPMGKTSIPQDIIYSMEPQINTGITAFDSMVNPTLPAPINIGNSVNPIQILLFIGTVIWVVGMVAMVIYSIIVFIKLKRNLITAVHFKENIYLVDHIATPFVTGLFKPKIYLPSSLTETEMGFIIAHEMCHVKRFDHITRVAGFVALTVHWFNPLVWIAFVVSGKDMELSADEAVMKKMNTDIRIEYSQSLLRFGAVKRGIHATPLAFGEGDTKNRVKNVLNYKKPAFLVIVVSVIAIVAVGVGLMANPKNKPLLIPKSNEATSIRLEQINGGKSIGVIETTDKNQIETILKAMENTNKTKQQSVNDSPNQKDYFQIDINADQSHRSYLYSDGKQYYMEEPYVGIYKTSRETRDSIAFVYTSNGGTDPVSLNPLSDAQYSITKHDKNGDVLAAHSQENQELAVEILMDGLMKSATTEGLDISTLEEYYVIRQTYSYTGEAHDYYAYRLADGTAVLQFDTKEWCSVLSDNLYESLAKDVLYSDTNLGAQPLKNPNYHKSLTTKELKQTQETVQSYFTKEAPYYEGVVSMELMPDDFKLYQNTGIEAEYEAGNIIIYKVLTKKDKKNHNPDRSVSVARASKDADWKVINHGF